MGAKKLRVMLILAALLFGCTSASKPLSVELAARDKGQQGPRVIIARGALPNGRRWVLLAYRRVRAQICFIHVWYDTSGYESAGACTPEDKPKQIQSTVTFPSQAEEFEYMVGTVANGTGAKLLRARNGTKTQDFPLLSNPRFAGITFFIGKVALPGARLPTTVELVDAAGTVVHSESFRWG
jgi:hypothetical protein